MFLAGLEWSESVFRRFEKDYDANTKGDGVVKCML